MATDQNRIDGPESLPKSIMKKRLGEGSIEQLLSVERRMVRDRPIQLYSWIDADEMYDSTLGFYDELMEFDPRFSLLASHVGKTQQNLGVTLSTKYARSNLGLRDPMQDDLFMSCLDAVIDELLEGVGATLKHRGSVIPRVLINRSAFRGDGSNGAKGQNAAIWTQQVMLPAMRNSPDGVFLWEKEILAIMTSLRRQLNKISANEDGELHGKYRLSLTFPNKSASHVEFNTTSDGNDGYIGTRARHVNAVPHMVNIPLMVVNSLYVDNLTDQMKKIWKFDLPRLRDKFVGGPVHAIDFAQFEATQPRELRHYVAKRLYSNRVYELAQHIDRLPIAGVYTDFPSGKNHHDSYYWWIDRFNNSTLADEFSPLLSGTGDTALMGKVLGTASQLTHFCRALGKSPKEVLPTGGGANTLAATCCANLGDDQANGFRAMIEQGANPSEMTKILDKHLQSIVDTNYFDNTLELDPPKIAGLVAWNEELGNANSNVIAMSHDPVSLVANRVFKEQDFDSPIRGDEIVGLHQGLSVYEESLSTYYDSDVVKYLSDITLDIIRCPYDRNELAAESDRREKEIMASQDENPVLQAQLEAMRLLNLKDISELDYNVDKEDLLKLPDHVLQHLWIALDEDLVSNTRDFLNESVFKG